MAFVPVLLLVDMASKNGSTFIALRHSIHYDGSDRDKAENEKDVHLAVDAA
jgi:hypothetical protein